MAEMTAKEFLDGFSRMCSRYKGNCCGGCMIDRRKSRSCFDFISEHQTETIQIVKNYIEKHPQKKILEDFLEKYPKSPMCTLDIPFMCVRALGYTGVYDKGECNGEIAPMGKCISCWENVIEVEV